jgi:hypothetical protein
MDNSLGNLATFPACNFLTQHSVVYLILKAIRKVSMIVLEEVFFLCSEQAQLSFSSIVVMMMMIR